MADTEDLAPATLLDQLASPDPQERREVAAIVRGLSETLAEVSDGKTASHVLGLLAYLLDPGLSTRTACTENGRLRFRFPTTDCPESMCR